MEKETKILEQKVIETAHGRIAYLASGPEQGPLMIFLHGWPELSLIWTNQLNYCASKGWRCIGPDMRGYGSSSVPDTIAAYAINELVGDMLALQDAVGGKPAVWLGHDWGCPVAWALAAHHPQRCRAVVALCVPYFARGFALSNLLPFIDRTLYPIDKFPAGQWVYFLHYRESFGKASSDFEADVSSTISALYRRSSVGNPDKPAFSSGIRANGGWFEKAHKAPAMPLDTSMLSAEQYGTMVATFKQTGFKGVAAWYLNDEANLAYAVKAPNFGIINLPVLFIHAAWDTVCNTVHSHLAEPMRADCSDLTELTIAGGHEIQIECPDEVNAGIAAWLTAKQL